MHWILTYWQAITFGFLLCFFSSFGQSFFISLYFPYWQEHWSLDFSTLSLIYGVVTLVSGITFPLIGSLVDRHSIRTVASFVLFAFSLVSLWLSQAESLYTLIFCLFGLRFFGQGLMSHVAQTWIAKSFTLHRGRVLSLTGLGHSVGEGVLPFTFTVLIVNFGWEKTWIFISTVVFLAVIILRSLLSGPIEAPKAKIPTPNFFWHAVFSVDGRFLYWAAAGLIPGGVLTALFILNAEIALLKG